MIFVSDSLGLPVNTGKYSFGHRGHQTESPTPDLHYVNHVKIPVQPDQSNDDRIAILGSLGANQNCTVLMAQKGDGRGWGPYWIPAICCSTFYVLEESLVPLHFGMSQFAKSAEEGKMEKEDRRCWGLSSKLCTLCSTFLTNHGDACP